MHAEAEKIYLVVMDVPGIKKFVFGTERLVEIRGASAMLAELNEIKTSEFLNETLGDDRVEIVFSGGGSGQFIARGTELKIKNALKGLQKQYAEKSKGGLRVLFGISEYSDKMYAECLKNAHADLKRKKDENTLVSCSSLHTGFMRECESCSKPASEISEYTHMQEKRLVCEECFVKIEYGKKKGLWKKFSDFAQSRKAVNVNNLMPEDFEEIGKRCKARNGYTALVYADGNAMGKLIKEIKNKEDFRFFSETVDEAVKTACHTSILECCREVNKKIPASILLLGGDDLLVYLSAETALPFAIEATQQFEQITQQKFKENMFFSNLLKGKGLTISLGIAYGKYHTPFSIMFSQAEELLKSSKKKGAADPISGDFYSPTYIDYHIASQFNQIRVSDTRKYHLGGGTSLELYQKPYSLPNIRKLLSHAEKLSQMVPRSRLKRLGYAPFAGKVNGTLECLKIYSRSPEKHRMALFEALSDFNCMPNMPWKEEGEVGKLSTMLTDLAELIEFSCGGQTDQGGLYE